MSLNSVERDRRFYLNPFTNLVAKETQEHLVISRGRGVYVYDESGREYIEGMSGLWCVSLGWSEERLVEAATRQMRELPYYHSFTGKLPDVTVELAEKLMEIAPSPLGKVVFANSGSESNDTAVKVAWYYNNQLGRPEKKKIISRMRGYHGVTVISGSMTGLAYAQSGFDLPMSRVIHTDCPHHYRHAEPGESEDAFAARLARNIDELIQKEGPETVAAFIAEPIQGAGGVIVPPETYFRHVQPVLKKHDVLMIADEVICGFGRTGNMFGSQTLGIEPDMMVVAKQLSSGYQPISGLLLSDQIYNTLRDASGKLGMFGHGYTYSGHPVPAAVALETLKIYEERNMVERVRELAPVLQDGIRQFAEHPMIGHVRGMGLIGAVELVKNKATKEQYDPSQKAAATLVSYAQKHGLIVRALPMDAVAFCPPLIIEPSQIEEMLARFALALDDTAKHFGVS